MFWVSALVAGFLYLVTEDEPDPEDIPDFVKPRLYVTNRTNTLAIREFDNRGDNSA